MHSAQKHNRFACETELLIIKEFAEGNKPLNYLLGQIRVALLASRQQQHLVSL